MTTSEISEMARRILAEAIVWDDHSGFGPHPDVDLDHLQIWRNAGVDYLSVDAGFDVMEWTDTLKTLAAFRRWILAHADEYVFVQSTESVRRAKREGKLAVSFDLEGMNALDGRLDMVGLYHALGVRQMGLAYNLNNLAGGGCHDEDIGLTDFGREVIQEMNRLGMLIDCSHASYQTSMEAIHLSADPVIFSHSNPRALCDHERNIRDDQISACAEKGGVIGVCGIGAFLGEDDIRTERIADHVDYLVRLVGPDHVGIGLDYDFEVESVDDFENLTPEQAAYWPPDQYDTQEVSFASPDQLLELTEELLARRYSSKDIHKILGENFLRVASQVWDRSRPFAP
jgi:membrane dipeptidase